MSDTPRTDAEVVRGGEFLPTPVQFLCRQLERELAAVTKERDEARANVAQLLGQKDLRISDLKGRLALCQEDSARFVKELEAAEARIKRLEEAGDALHDAVWSALDWGGTHVGDCSNKWSQAKEAKP
jgi:hypothetical protein